ncbi:uncharacterized protein [Centruroides vittatus]|uniref:uncharacterized protein n=1 Tax=Centruroides vittatus TaxID=120091 RepID=UPI00350F9CFC
MHFTKLLFLLFFFTQILLMYSPVGLIIVIPLKLKFPLKTLIAYGLFKTVKKKLFRNFFRLATPFGLRRTDPLKYRQADKSINHAPSDDHLQDQLFQYLSAEDHEGCLKRLVCEVHASHRGNAMGVAESVIIDLFGKMSPQHQSLPSFEFHQAATIGHKSKDVRMCHQYYSTCPYNSQQLLSNSNYFPLEIYPT